MTLEDAETQEAVEGLTAFEDTKRGYGLWRGWIKRNLGPENMPVFMRNLKGEE